MEKRYKDSLDRDEVIHIGLSALKDKFEGEMNSKSIEIGYIDAKQGKFIKFSKSEVEDAISFLRE